ncbi:hypothetical protein LXL04_024668 [Taraxacum kok-saghyz]
MDKLHVNMRVLQDSKLVTFGSLITNSPIIHMTRSTLVLTPLLFFILKGKSLQSFFKIIFAIEQDYNCLFFIFQEFQVLLSHLSTNAVTQSGREFLAIRFLIPPVLSSQMVTHVPSKLRQVGPVASGAEQAATLIPPVMDHVPRPIGSGEMQCNGAGATPPATLAEFTLGSGSTTQDFYDVSLVDGYNLQMIVEVSGGSGDCRTTGCVDDLNRRCPSELRVEGGGGGCRSACEAFGTPEYCCKGDFGSPSSCQPTAYSEVFKAACPRSYSYAYDDATSTFTCTDANYIITFCPSLPSGKVTTGLMKPTNGSGSDPLKELFSNSSLYVDLAAGCSNGINQFSLKLIFISFTIYFVSISFFSS